MRKSRLLSIFYFCFLVFFATPSNAVTIVDTGPGPDTGGISHGLFGPGSAGRVYGQSLAGEFTISGDTIVTGIDGWMGFTGNGADGTIAIYSDGGDVPGSELFSTTFFGTGSLDRSWVGVNGLSWDLAAGTYWVSFEVRAGQTISSSMPGPSSSPLGNDAFTSTDDGTWRGVLGDNQDIGVRIEAVPEPTSLLLLGSGLVGMIGLKRMKR